MIDDQAILGELLEAEGWPRYTDDPDDRGGPTRGGITLATLSAWRGRTVTRDDLRALTEEEARSIYRTRYITLPRFDAVPDPLLRWQVVDCGVLHGPGRASRWLQEALGGGLVADGIIGPRTQESLATTDPRPTAIRLAAIRCRFIGEIIAGNYRARRRGRSSQDQARFAGGWLNRATRFLDLEASRADS